MKMPTPQHHLQGFAENFLPSAVDKATAVVAGVGSVTAVLAGPDPLATAVKALTAIWLLVQIGTTLWKTARGK
jgi:hypothetical protein